MRPFWVQRKVPRRQENKHLTWSTKVDQGRPWSTMADHRRPWSTMVDHGRSWSTNVDHGRPRSTMVHHGRPCNDPPFPAAGSMELVTWPARILEGSPKCKAVGPKIPIILYCKVSRMRRACGKSSGDWKLNSVWLAKAIRVCQIPSGYC